MHRNYDYGYARIYKLLSFILYNVYKFLIMKIIKNLFLLEHVFNLSYQNFMTYQELMISNTIMIENISIDVF